MACGEAYAIHKRTGKRYCIVDVRGRPRWSDLWDGLDFLTKDPSQGQPYLNAPGARPYILEKTHLKWIWKPYKPKPAIIKFTNDELRFAREFEGCIAIEPNVKCNINKAWIPFRWIQVAKEIGKRCIQVTSPTGGYTLPNVKRQVRPPTFRHAAAVLAVCDAAVLTEGGLHHSAAAVGTPAVVLYGGFISDENTGYDLHRNLFTGDKACGMRVFCPHCKEAMERITVSMVMEELQSILGSGK